MGKVDQDEVVSIILDRRVRLNLYSRKLLKNRSILSFCYVRNTICMKTNRNKVKEKTRLNFLKKQQKSGLSAYREKRDKLTKKRNRNCMSKLLNSVHIHLMSTSQRLTLMQFVFSVRSILLVRSFMMVLSNYLKILKTSRM